MDRDGVTIDDCGTTGRKSTLPLECRFYAHAFAETATTSMFFGCGNDFFIHNFYVYQRSQVRGTTLVSAFKHDAY